MSRMNYDPLSCIPTSHAIRRKLAEAREAARRLQILLRTAEQIENRSGDASDHGPIGDQPGSIEENGQ